MSQTSKAGFDLPTKSVSDRRRASRIYAAFEKAYPDANCALDYRSPHELLIATILVVLLHRGQAEAGGGAGRLPGGDRTARL